MRPKPPETARNVDDFYDGRSLGPNPIRITTVDRNGKIKTEECKLWVKRRGRIVLE